MANERDLSYALVTGTNVPKYVHLIVLEEGAEFRRKEVKRQQLKEINQVTTLVLQVNDLIAGAFWRVKTVKRRGRRSGKSTHE